jgi:SAM-dependent methyltransferase
LLGHLHRQLVQISREDTPVAKVYGAASRGIHDARTAVSGARFHCPICNGWFLHFLPFGLNQRRHAKCPGCGSLERHRFLWLYLRDQMHLTRHRASILHVAPETPIQDNLSQHPNLNYATIDLYDPSAAHQMDLTNLSFDSGKFDVIICSHVLEHIEDDRSAITEMARVLRSGGRAIILVPVDAKREKTYEDSLITTPSERLEAFGHPYHVRICGADYSKRIGDAGFEVKEIYSSTLMPHRRRLLRINKTVLYDCRRLD